MGPCIFPFKYKDQIYNECYKGAQGDWCATEVDAKGKMKKYAFCDCSEKEETTKSNSPKNTVKPSNSAPSSKSTKKLIKFKPKFNPDSLPKELQLPNPKRIIPDIYELPNRKHFKTGFLIIIKTMYQKRCSKIYKGCKI